MATSYNKIYSNALSKLKDYDIPNMTDEEIKDYLQDYLSIAITRFHLCKSNLNDKDDDRQEFNQTLSDKEIDIIGNYLVMEFIDSNYIRTPTLLKATLSSKDFNSYSPANMLDKLISMQDKYLKDTETLLARYTWFNNNYAKSLLVDNNDTVLNKGNM